MRCFLMLPQTFMNNSGYAVGRFARNKRISLEECLIVYDDLDLAFGTMRLRASGSAGGHQGVQSAIDHVHTAAFPRLRLGIGRPAAKEDTVEFVLSPFDRIEQRELSGLIDRAVDCCEYWLAEGTARAMNTFNAKEGQ